MPGGGNGCDLAPECRRRRPVSSAILYLAIVAIWAFLLVPRWVRRPHAGSGSEPGGAVASEFADGAGGEAAGGSGVPEASEAFEAAEALVWAAEARAADGRVAEGRSGSGEGRSG